MKRIILTSALVLTGILAFAQSSTKFTTVLANTTGKTINVESILAEPVVLSSPTPSRVTSFNITFMPAGHSIQGPYEIKGNTLSAETIKVLGILKSGDRIVIDKVKVNSGKEVDAEGITYTIGK